MSDARLVEFVPLFNFAAEGEARLELGADAWIEPLRDVTRAFVVSQVNRPDVSMSRDLLENLRFGLFHRFEPSDPSMSQPRQPDLEADVRLVFKILKPGSAVSTGYSAYYSETGSGAAGSRVAPEFPRPGARYDLTAAETALLPRLWQELRRLLSPPWLLRARFLDTARARLWRASHEQHPEQKLLDLFIALESVLLRDTERWAEKGRSVGAARLAVLLDPQSPAQRGGFYAAARAAHDQRNAVAHGFGRELLGFDGDPGGFGALVFEVERWTTVAIHRMLRLLFECGSQDKALARLDGVASDPVTHLATVRLLLGHAPSERV
jgi:hypothetical protein